MTDPSTVPAQRGRRAALSPAMTTFIVIDVILVLTFLALLAMGLGDRSTEEPVAQESPTQPASGPDEAESEPEETAPGEPDDAQAVNDFQMPSGNIFCTMTDTSADCTIVSFSYEAPAPPEGCAGTVGPVISLVAGQEPTLPCVDTAPTGPPEGMPVLQYGSASTVGEMTCQSSPNGIYCQHNPTGRGFSLARAGYRFF